MGKIDMDYEKLIDMLLWWANNCDRTNNGCMIRSTLQYAADALAGMTSKENKPLTPEELREMEGQPVWTVGVSFTDDGKDAMWDIVEKADDEGVDFGYSTESREWWNYNLRDKDGKLLNCAWVCYRRPTEGEEDA